MKLKLRKKIRPKIIYHGFIIEDLLIERRMVKKIANSK